jgi:uncharacterized SAM-binding protein YcdF (DUF218 family)
VLLSVLKFIGGPGSVGLLIVSVTVITFTARLFPAARRIARLILLSLAVTYLVLALPMTANAIAKRLTACVPLSDLNLLRQTDILIVFDGDNRWGRVREAVRLWRAHHSETVIVSGEQWMVEHIVAGGIPQNRLRYDETATTTREQMDLVRRLTDGHRRGVIVTSRLQAPRVEALVRTAGLSAIIAAAAVDDEPPVTGWKQLVPSYVALRVSRDAIYEHLALRYYGWRRWIDVAASPSGACGVA